MGNSCVCGGPKPDHYQCPAYELKYPVQLPPWISMIYSVVSPELYPQGDIFMRFFPLFEFPYIILEVISSNPIHGQ